MTSCQNDAFNIYNHDDCLMSAPAVAKTVVYISLADDGDIAAMDINPETGDLTMIGKARAGNVVMPMAVSPDRKFLYAAIRSLPYMYANFEINPTTGQLAYAATGPSPDNMVYISTDKTGRYLLGASYAGHKVSVTAINDKGILSARPLQVLDTGRHAHSIISDPSNRFVYVPLLGEDEILQFIFDEKSGALRPNSPASVKTQPNYGPRHIIFSPNGRFAYATNELVGMVTGYSFDQNTGLLNEITSSSILPKDTPLVPGKIGAPLGGPAPSSVQLNVTHAMQASDLHMSPDGKYLYASERTSSTIAILSADTKSGLLKYIGNVETESRPRGFRIDPTGNFLIVGGQKSDHCTVYRIQKDTGLLQPLKRYNVGKNPNWIEIVEIP